MANLNRIKVVLVENNKTGKWLANELDKSPCYCKQMVSKLYPARLKYIG